jgi:hypothetical protein
MCSVLGPQKSWMIHEYKYLTRGSPTLYFKQKLLSKVSWFWKCHVFQIVFILWHQIARLFDKPLPIAGRVAMGKMWVGAVRVWSQLLSYCTLIILQRRDKIIMPPIHSLRLNLVNKSCLTHSINDQQMTGTLARKPRHQYKYQITADSVN